MVSVQLEASQQANNADNCYRAADSRLFPLYACWAAGGLELLHAYTKNQSEKCEN